MMVRVIWIACFLSVLVLVLYVPSAYPPERFVAQLNEEHEANANFWGEQRAINILSRMLEFDLSPKDSGLVPFARPDKRKADVILSSVEQSMARTTSRLFDNQYFRSIDTLFALAKYRLSALLEWLPYLAAFICAAIFDGGIRRLVKSKDFQHHSPELFALHVIIAIVLVCATIVLLVLPVGVHPLVFVVVPAALAVLASGAIANFHRRG